MNMKGKITTVLVALTGWFAGFGVAWAYGPCPGSISIHSGVNLISGNKKILYSGIGSLPDSPRPYKTAALNKLSAWSNSTCALLAQPPSCPYGGCVYEHLNRIQAQYLNSHPPALGLTSNKTKDCDSEYVIKYDRTNCEKWPASETYDVICHEQGHTLGLGERLNNGVSCMGSGSTITSPDISDVNTNYQGHGHGCY